jgi:5-methylcytosine-specific restriction endonuclease McrA
MTSEMYPPNDPFEKANWKVIKLGDAIYSLKYVFPKLARKLEKHLAKAVQEREQIKAQIEVERQLLPNVIRRYREEIARKYQKFYRAIVARDGEFCQYCKTTNNLTIDHKTALVKGGNNDLENLQLLCGSCNSRKHAK